MDKTVDLADNNHTVRVTVGVTSTVRSSVGALRLLGDPNRLHFFINLATSPQPTSKQTKVHQPPLLLARWFQIWMVFGLLDYSIISWNKLRLPVLQAIEQRRSRATHSTTVPQCRLPVRWSLPAACKTRFLSCRMPCLLGCDITGPQF